ncbi:hypothetical protein TRFO_02678 [Tritrichomonas foetus]|uniref:non-specific serine/threonine protein kinase n=1 Tax=Tritrichomonas foetus TaxID=1144522 RepID=A0A1J4L393_9EUKA|nr:hypothetical protein TRFO_02678 [Tritrichomonas foetus]|eukprot:OHT16422.1 hypothetical protein TRFO_02678 [Tritrichomonas foetus]
MLFSFLTCFASASVTGIIEQGLTTEWFGTTFGDSIYVGTADGHFHRVNLKTGDVEWSFDTGGPTFNSTYSRSMTYFPSIDGFLVSYFPKYGYRRFPIPIRDLVFLAPFVSENGQIFTSGKSMTIFFLDDNGNVISSFTSNSSIPIQSIEGDKTTIVRVDYSLSIHGDSSESIKYSEFSIISANNPQDEENNVTNHPQIVKATTTFGGAVSITVDDKVTQFMVPGTPVSIVGSEGVFDFTTEKAGLPLSEDEIFLLNCSGSPLAIPPRPLKSLSNDGLKDDLPQLNGTQGSENNESLVEGSHALRPFMYIRSLTPAVDFNRLANVMTDSGPGRITIYKRSLQPTYFVTSLTLIVMYVGLRFIEKLTQQLTMSMQITFDKDDPNQGSFGGEKCTIVRVKREDRYELFESILRDRSELVGLPTIRAVKTEEGVHTILYQLLVQYNFDEGFDPKYFIKKAMLCLQSLFKNNLVHGSIAEETVFVGGNNEPLFGGYEETIRRSTEEKDRAEDILAVAKIVKSRLIRSQNTTPNNTVNSITSPNTDNIISANGNNDSAVYDVDPLLEDLLEEMTRDEFIERPTPHETLRHPLFYTGLQKMNLLCHASDFLMSPTAKERDLPRLFDENYSDVVGANWMHTVDERLLNDALQNADYKDDSLVDLVRFIRNKYMHPLKKSEDEMIRSIMNNADNYFQYFHKMFPNLFLYTYYFIDKYDPAQAPGVH